MERSERKKRARALKKPEKANEEPPALQLLPPPVSCPPGGEEDLNGGPKVGFSVTAIGLHLGL